MPDLNPSEIELWQKTRQKLLEKYQANAEELFSKLKEIYPEKTLFDYYMDMLILSSFCPAPAKVHLVLKTEIVRLLDTEISIAKNAILPQPEKQEDNSSVHDGTGEKKDGPV